MYASIIKCRCMHVKQVQKWIKLKEYGACEGSRRNGDHWCKNGKLMGLLRKEIYNLKQYFYKLQLQWSFIEISEI